MVQKILTEILTNFQQFVTIFPIEVFHLVGYLRTSYHLFICGDPARNKSIIIISEAPLDLRVAFFTATTQGSLRIPISCSQ